MFEELFTSPAFATCAAIPKPGEFRAVIGEAVKRLSAPNMVHVDASRLLTRPDGLSPDLLHPTARGFSEIATRLSAELKKVMDLY